MQKRWLYPLTMLLLLTLLIGYIRLTTRQTDKHQGADADGRQYVTMAGDSLMFGKQYARFAPFCYRVATPWMASRLPGNDVIAKFGVLAWIDSALMLLLAFALMRILGFSHWDSLLGMALYGAVFWTVKFAFYAPCYIDHQSQVIVLLILCVMAKGWWPLLPILIFGAYFQKESVVALVPIYMVYYLQQKGWKWWPLYILGILSLAAVIIPYFILRNHVHPLNTKLGTPLFAITDAWRIMTHTPGYPRILLVAIFSGLGILPLILLSHGRWTWGYLRAQGHWLTMMIIGLLLLLGGQDKARLFLHMLPAIMVVAVAVIRDLRGRLANADYRAWLVMVLVLHFFAGHHFSAFRDFDDYLNTMVPEHSGTQGGQGFTRMTIAVTLFLIGNYVLRKREKPLEGGNQVISG